MKIVTYFRLPCFMDLLSSISFCRDFHCKPQLIKPSTIHCMVLRSKNKPINTLMASFKLVFLFVLVSCFLNFAAIEAQELNFIYHICSEKTSNSNYQVDLRNLLYSLSSKATANAEFYNNTVTSRSRSDTVYGLFMCRGDILPPLCGQCVASATQKLSLDSACSMSKQAVIWYDECMVRYSDRSFFSTVVTSGLASCNIANISDQASFMRLMLDTMNKTADEAANASIGAKKYATKQANISGFQSLYCLAQCTQDLSPRDCSACLSDAIRDLLMWCEGRQGGRALYPSCNIRYELYPFYRSTGPGTSPTPVGLVPATNNPDADADSRYSENPRYLSHNCSSIETFTANSAFQLNLRTLLSYFSSNATSGKEFQKDDVDDDMDDRVFGLFMCRNDLPPRLCGQCVLNATERISSNCSSSKEAIIWYSHCLLRYSYRSLASTVDKSPRFDDLNITSTSNPDQEQNSFTSSLSNTLSQVAAKAGESDQRYGTESLKLNAMQTLYTLAQCTRDLSSDECVECLSDMIGSAIPWRLLGSVGGRVLYPSCNVRFELFQFYRDFEEAQVPGPASPSPSGPAEKRKGRSRTVFLIIAPIVVSAMLLFFGCYLLRRKARKSLKTILRENFGQESATLQPLQFDLVTLKAATNNFSHENRIGKGGFGEVYKGVLLDGRQIAVKRLSRNSMQGPNEFKNEILLIAKLQHRNLVAFIGFCLEEQEKLLVYEYVPNGSLDCFLFGTQQQKLFSWFERYNIIKGIARRILYLHEYSRLKIIHRDLKPSNVLLDENMNPKVSDFGLARIVEINQSQGSTNRIVGTHGYMPPEYIMFGQFSEKSDVFSFGVMVLEIITGKKNASAYELHPVADGLLSHVWRQWRDQTPLSILDSNIKENSSKIEVIKCIQIGLLCVQQNPDARPTMVTIVSYLSNHSIELPSPQEPAFFMQSQIDPKIVAQDSSSSQSVNSSAPFSINEMSISIFHPR